MVVLYDLLVVMAIGWGIYGLVQLLTGPSRLGGTGWPAPLLILVSLIPLTEFVLQRYLFDGHAPVAVRALVRSSGYLIGPLLWLHAVRFLSPHPVPARRLVLHAAPFLLSLALFSVRSLDLQFIPPVGHELPGFLGPPIPAGPARASLLSPGLRSAPLPLAPGIQDFGKFASVLVYGLAILARLALPGRTREVCSSSERGASSERRIRLLTALCLGTFLLPSLALGYLVVSGAGDALTVAELNSFPLILFLFLFVSFARLPSLAGDVDDARSGSPRCGREGRPPASEASPLEGSKYLRSRLDEQEIEETYEALLRCLERTKLYREAEVSLSDLADRLGVSRHHLSQIINTRTADNFSTLINRFRVEEFVRCIEHGEHRTKTLAAIALDCGFNSYATFYTAFKRVCGMTPRAFLARLRTGRTA